MKVMIADTLGYYANYVIPSEKKGCAGLMASIALSIQNNDEFKKRIHLAKFIFDDVEHYRPTFTPKGGDVHFCKILSVIYSDGINTIPLNEEKFNKQLRESDIKKKDIEKFHQIINKICPDKKMLNSGLLLTPDPYLSRVQIESIDGLSRESIISMLATCGVDFILPSIFIKENDEIEKFKEKFSEERYDYLIYLNDKASQLADMIKNDKASYAAIVKFAKEEVAVNLSLKAKRIEAAFEKEGNRAIKHMYDDFKKRIVSIGPAAFTLDFVTVAKDLLQILASSLKSKDETSKILQKYPEATYLYKIKTR